MVLELCVATQSQTSPPPSAPSTGRARSYRAARALPQRGGDRCLLCVCALDTAAENASAFSATLISEQLSQKKSPGESRQAPASQCCSIVGGELCGNGGRGCCSSAKASEPPPLRSLLCYSCQLTIKDMASEEVLPQYILSEAERRLRRSQLREEIRGFLLEGEADEG
ncbi:hypothetical protein CgunFtcFv8_016023 [Champsocephalus gunnari]|uniref:Uncharacterized protein n=1 Tax=Champsocephalus gunnari TaxID=52237 RepID=A0AAN8CT11_CHAGU|nr:hypothetical protein CgunFtcFv8_016023 [Champsocephalus gunnari]